MPAEKWTMKTTATLSGQIERITFSNPENGFTIAKVKTSNRRDLVTVVGNLMAPTPGEVLEMKGEWSTHPKFGEQFKVADYKTVVPASVDGIKKYLGSGLIKGLGPVMAERIVAHFGKKSLDIIEHHIEKLSVVDGIGKKRLAMIRAAWEDQREIRDLMIFLQSHGVGSGHAVKIFKQYRSRAISVVRQNPYRLATDIFGIGFVTADAIAAKLGFDRNSPLRAGAGILYVLNQLADEGNMYYPYPTLLEKCAQVLGVDREVLLTALDTLVLERKIIIEDLSEPLVESRENFKAVYLDRLHFGEVAVADRLNTLLTAPKDLRPIDSARAIEWVQQQLAIRLAADQVKAVRSALDDKLLVITGGPGTGKTTITHAILQIFSRLGARSLLAAPTGRAAKRMSEAAGHDAKTIHRLLEFSFQKGGFQRNSENPLDCQLLIVDEASMIDTLLMQALLGAVPPGATLILVGDANQLPSVGPGNVLGDIIASGVVPVVELKEIFRQAGASQIVVNAHRINNGMFPLIEPPADAARESDFYFIQQEDPDRVLETILKLIGERIPHYFKKKRRPGRTGFDPLDDVQVLTPMHRGIVGAANLNERLQDALNPGENGLVRGQRGYRLGDKVMQIRNNYDKEVFNGDIGRIRTIDPVAQELTVSFDDRQVRYDFADLDEIVLAYAVSVHKSQGSEYPAVVIPVLTQHYVLLQRNLIYTAITRGRELVVLVGTRKALAIAINNDKPQQRFTHLKQRLR